MDDLKECREEFEAWHGKTFCWMSRPDIIDSSRYADQRTQERWETWQAAWNRRAVPQANAEQDAQDKIDAARYRSWRLAVITGDEEMVDRVADALPNSEDEYPTAEQWDAAVDAAIRAASNAASEVKNG